MQVLDLEGVRALAHTVDVDECLQTNVDVVDLFLVLGYAFFCVCEREQRDRPRDSIGWIGIPNALK